MTTPRLIPSLSLAAACLFAAPFAASSLAYPPPLHPAAYDTPAHDDTADDTTQPERRRRPRPDGPPGGPPAAAPPAPAAEKPKDAPKEDQEPDRFLVIKNAVIHPVTSPDLYDATIVCKNGKIDQIARHVIHPDDAKVIDAAGYHVYPGLVAIRSAGVVGSDPPEDSTDVFGLNVALALAGGITTHVPGNTAAKATFATLDDMIIKENLWEQIRYSTSSPQSRKQVREGFEKVRKYIRDLEAHEQKKKDDPAAKPPADDAIKGQNERYYRLIKRQAVAVADADSAHDIVDLCDLAQEFGFKLVIRGADEGWTVAPRMALAGVSAIVGGRTSGGLFGNEYPIDEESNRPSGPTIRNAAILRNAGVPVAIYTRATGISLVGLGGRDLLQLNLEAGFAVRGGLTNEQALRAITIDAARIAGIDHRVGSIEVGKDADLVIADGDMLHYTTHARWTIVNGRIAYDKQKDTLFDHIPDHAVKPPLPDDYWPRRLGQDWAKPERGITWLPDEDPNIAKPKKDDKKDEKKDDKAPDAKNGSPKPGDAKPADPPKPPTPPTPPKP